MLARGEDQTSPCLQGGRSNFTHNITFVQRLVREDQISSINAPQKYKLKALETEVVPSDICKRDQCILHNVTISGSASALISPLGLSIALFSNFQSPVNSPPIPSSTLTKCANTGHKGPLQNHRRGKTIEELKKKKTDKYL